MLPDDEIEITFNFTDNRLFHYVDIHTNNMFTKDVQVCVYFIRNTNYLLYFYEVYITIYNKYYLYY